MKIKFNILTVTFLMCLLYLEATAQIFEKVANININGSGQQNTFTVFNGKLYFAAGDSTGKIGGLWKSDGTLAGTQLIASGLSPNTDGYYPNIIYNDKGSIL